MANFTRKQGEVWRTTIEMFDSNNCAILLASVGTTAEPAVSHAFFQGTASKILVSGTVYALPISFKLQPAEVIESGRGSNRMIDNGHFKVEAYIPSDINNPDSSDPLDFINPVSTIEMEPGDWNYVIRYSDAPNPTDDDNVRVIVQGVLTIEERIADLGDSDISNFTYTAPTE